MEKIVLRHLRQEDESKFIKALNAKWEAGFSFAHYWESLGIKNFKRYIEIVPDFPEGKHIPENHVPCTFLFAFNDENELVGRTSIRHDLNDELLKVGGHIGYGVIPSYRRRGYATTILYESLNYVRENLPEIEKVLVTCDEGNTGSQKTIEKNGGTLEDILDVGKEVRKMRFWINIREVVLEE
jgi:predicted acetyltransferase